MGDDGDGSGGVAAGVAAFDVLARRADVRWEAALGPGACVKHELNL
jgi:hypothetical protein